MTDPGLPPPAGPEEGPAGWVGLRVPGDDGRDPDGFDDAALVDTLGVWERLRSFAEGRQQELIARLWDRRRVEDEAGVHGEESRGGVAQDFVAEEIACVLGVSVGTASRRVSEAVRTETDVPGLRAALFEGRIDVSRARMLLGETHDLAGEVAAGIIEGLLPIAATTPWRVLRALARARVMAADPGLARELEAIARRRGVHRRVVNEVITRITANLTHEEAALVWAHLDAAAQSALAADAEAREEADGEEAPAQGSAFPPGPSVGEPYGEGPVERMVSEARADALVDLITEAVGVGGIDPDGLESMYLPDGGEEGPVPAGPAPRDEDEPDLDPNFDFGESTDAHGPADPAVSFDPAGRIGTPPMGPAGREHDTPAQPENDPPRPERDRARSERDRARPDNDPARPGHDPGLPGPTARPGAGQPTGSARAPARRRTAPGVCVNLTMPYHLLFPDGFASDHDGRVIAWARSTAEFTTADGIELLTASRARASAWELLAHGARLRLIALDDQGHAQAVTTPAYRPPDWLADAVRTRDRTCRFPGCLRPAEACDLDHVIPYEHGGPTSQANLRALCRRHHRMKSRTRWRVHTEPDGTTRWTAPTGHEYIQYPTRYPTPHAA